MRPKALRSPALLVLLALALAGGAAAAPRPQGPLRAYLPGDAAAPGWAKDGEPQEFEGEDLYIYIDGGAEIYEEYGFRRVILQDFKNATGKSVSLEIFEMETPAAAFGMFTFKRSGQGRSLELGGGGELEAYYLNFWRGRFLVTLTGFDASEGTVEGLLSIGGAVAAKLPGGGETPGLIASLPPEGLRSGSVKYLKGLLGLNNVYPFYTARGLAFKDAVRGSYDSGETLILLDYGSAEARRSAWIELRTELEGSERFEAAKNDLADAAAFEDGKGRYVAFGAAGARLAVGIHATMEGALATVARVR